MKVETYQKTEIEKRKDNIFKVASVACINFSNDNPAFIGFDALSNMAAFHAHKRLVNYGYEAKKVGRTVIIYNTLTP